MKVDRVATAPMRRGGPLWSGLLVVLSATALLVANSPAQAAKKVKVKAVVTAVEELNPDYKGRPSPVNIIVFQLASADAFANADFFSLFEPEAAVLGGDMLAKTQILLQPGEKREWVAEFDKGTRYVGVIAAFRDIENAQWRASVELPKKGFFTKFFKKNKLRIAVDTLTVSVATK